MWFIDPPRQRRSLRSLRPLMVVMMMFAVSVFRAAMFAEPAISQIEKMGRLVHRT
jgi:hypothetical protein